MAAAQRLLAAACAVITAVALAAAQDTRVVLLGTGTPNPDPERSGPGVAVISGDRVYIVDCGPGVVRRAAQAGIRMDQVTRAFITHLHSDHTAGLPDLIFTPAVTGRTEALEIYGPPGIGAMTAHVLKAWREDMRIRLDGLEPANPAGYVVRVHTVKPGVAYRDGAVTVRAFAVNHGGWKHAYGYRFDAQDKSVVISGDTTASESLVSAAAGAGILVHEVYSRKGWEARTPEWRRYHAAFHTSAVELGKLAARIRPGKLVLYHQLPMGQPPDEVIGEIREHFDGEVIWGNDLQVIR
jgi:ribonuclease BN (tRNA processing enzyme)